jgi:hypothetical protein
LDYPNSGLPELGILEGQSRASPTLTSPKSS